MERIPSGKDKRHIAVRRLQFLEPSSQLRGAFDLVVVTLLKYSPIESPGVPCLPDVASWVGTI